MVNVGHCQSRSGRAGLEFPVGKIHERLRQFAIEQILQEQDEHVNIDESNFVSAGAPVYLASVMEMLTAEVLALSGEECKNTRQALIQPQHIQAAIKRDSELRHVVTSTPNTKKRRTN